MKHFSKIFIFVLAFVALCSCEQKSLVGGTTDDNEDDIFMPSGDYIFFNIQRPTRGALIEDNLQKKNFNVIGYNYPNQWDVVKVQASQAKRLSFDVQMGDNTQTFRPLMGVFYTGGDNQSSDTLTTTQGVQIVTYSNDGYHSYDFNNEGPKSWIGELKYSFFAWYPTSLKANGAIDRPNFATSESEPFITYNLTSETNRAGRLKMEDVMTACKIDINKMNVERDGGSVNFVMQHRLAALDIMASNIITWKNLKTTWEQAATEQGASLVDKNGLTIDPDLIDRNSIITVKEINSLTLTLDTIYSTAKIFLNTENIGDTTLRTIASGGYYGNRYTEFASDSVTLNYYSSTSEAKSLMGYSKLILIPQTKKIKAKLTMSYVVSCTNKNGQIYEYLYNPIVDDIDIKGLKEGYYHYLMVTFTASGVYVKAHVEESWDQHPVSYEFH